MNWKQLSPAELLENTGQTGPPVRIMPILEKFSIAFEHIDQAWARTDGHRLFLPPLTRARQPGVNLAIAHDLRQVQLGIAGRADDGAYPHLSEQEETFDRWARQLILPTDWFRGDAMRHTPVKQIAERYNVKPWDVIDRAQELELTPLICRDKASYGVYRSHPWWTQRRTAYFATHQICEQQGCSVRAAYLHHVNYVRLGRELDEDVRAVCHTHHHGVHRDRGQLELFKDVPPARR